MFAIGQEDLILNFAADQTGLNGFSSDENSHLMRTFAGLPQSTFRFDHIGFHIGFARPFDSWGLGAQMGRSPAFPLSLAIQFPPTSTGLSTPVDNSAWDRLTGIPSGDAWVMPASMTQPRITQTIQEQLDQSDDLNPTRINRFKDDYILQSDATGQVQIDMTSSDFDTYVQIIDGRSQQVIAVNDDGGGGTNSRLTFTAQAEVDYIIRATSYGVFERGNYALRAIAVSSSSPSAPNPSAEAFSFTVGYGAVNAANAVTQAINQSTPFPSVSDMGNSWSNNLINAPEVWNAGFNGQGVVVAVVDTGVDYTHPDLDDNIWRNPGEIAGNGRDDDGNGYVDDVIGWDFANNDNDPLDINGHGTHVAGTIAADNNGFGVTGVAYGATIMPVQVLGADGTGVSGAIANGIQYAADNGAQVINLSLGSNFYDPRIESAVRYAAEQGTLVVSAAGNSAFSQPGYPAQFATNWGVSVGAIDPSFRLAEFSNRAGNNSQLFHVVAPGVSIESTLPRNNYGSLSGTSMAAPHVSGVAALMLSANPSLTDDQIREGLVNTTV